MIQVVRYSVFYLQGLSSVTCYLRFCSFGEWCLQVFFFQQTFLLMFAYLKIIFQTLETKTKLNISLYISQDCCLEITETLQPAQKEKRIGSPHHSGRKGCGKIRGHRRFQDSPCLVSSCVLTSFSQLPPHSRGRGSQQPLGPGTGLPPPPQI